MKTVKTRGRRATKIVAPTKIKFGFGRATTVAEYVQIVSQLSALWNRPHEIEWCLWFRGEPPIQQGSYLIPPLYRHSGIKLTRLLDAEQELRLEFKRRGLQMSQNVRPNEHWEWYFMMQHHGVPTRLLDWTDSALLGLFFAIEQRHSEPEGDAAVFVMDPSWLNEKEFGKKSDWSGVALPDWDPVDRYLSEDELDNYKLRNRKRGLNCVAIDPPHISSRIAAQRSRFVIFARDKFALQRACRLKDSRIARIAIPAAKMEQLRAELRVMGVSREVAFPDLQGLGENLRQLLDDWVEKQ